MKKHGLWNRIIAIPDYLDELRINTKKYKRRISNEQICIVVAVDDEKNLIAKLVSVGRLEIADAKKLLSGCFDNDSTLITDSHSAYPVLANSENILNTFKSKPTNIPKADIISQTSMEFIHR